MKYKAHTVALFLFLSTIGIFLIYSDPHPRGFDASNISPERVKELLQSNPPETVSQLFTIVDALHRFSRDNDSYPISAHVANKGFIFISHHTNKYSWINGLVPTYLPNLPVSDIPDTTDQPTFIYRSNGGYFILLARNPEDCLWVKNNFRELLYEPTGDCIGYGVWTSRARL